MHNPTQGKGLSWFWDMCIWNTYLRDYWRKGSLLILNLVDIMDLDKWVGWSRLLKMARGQLWTSFSGRSMLHCIASYLTPTTICLWLRKVHGHLVLSETLRPQEKCRRGYGSSALRLSLGYCATPYQILENIWWRSFRRRGTSWHRYCDKRQHSRWSGLNVLGLWLDSGAASKTTEVRREGTGLESQHDGIWRH